MLVPGQGQAVVGEGGQVVVAGDRHGDVHGHLDDGHHGVRPQAGLLLELPDGREGLFGVVVVGLEHMVEEPVRQRGRRTGAHAEDGAGVAAQGGDDGPLAQRDVGAEQQQVAAAVALGGGAVQHSSSARPPRPLTS